VARALSVGRAIAPRGQHPATTRLLRGCGHGDRRLGRCSPLDQELSRSTRIQARSCKAEWSAVFVHVAVHEHDWTACTVHHAISLASTGQQHRQWRQVDLATLKIRENPGLERRQACVFAKAKVCCCICCGGRHTLGQVTDGLPKDTLLCSASSRAR
jgi:hypothetical protein